MTKASKMAFLSKPTHTPIHTLYSSADSWRLEFWLIHFPLIINILSPLQLPAIALASVGPWWNNAYPFVATACTREKELVLFSRSPWHCWKGLICECMWFNSSRLYFVFLFHGEAVRERKLCALNPKQDMHCWEVISKCSVRQHWTQIQSPLRLWKVEVRRYRLTTLLIIPIRTITPLEGLLSVLLRLIVKTIFEPEMLHYLIHSGGFDIQPPNIVGRKERGGNGATKKQLHIAQPGDSS